jgi:sialic acid synthase SpsE
MKIGDRIIASSSTPYVIAELGVNHDGSVEQALQLCEAAAGAGVDAVKLQMFEASRLVSRAATPAAYQRRAGANDPASMLAALQLAPDELHWVADHARQLGLHTLVTVFNIELVAEAERFEWDAYKVASPDVINRPLIETLMVPDA